MKKNTLLYTLGAIVIVLVVVWLVAPGDNTNSTANVSQNLTPPPSAGLEIQDTVEGTGDVVKVGDTVTVHYRGTLSDGTQFDSSYDRGTPFSFTVGTGQVIQGWEEGLLGMKKGGKRTLVIPPSLAYGDQSPSPLIPAGSTLHFEIELLNVTMEGKG